MVTFEEFKKLELRTAKILEIKPHPNADRRDVLTVEGGAAQKQIIAGIRQSYAETELVGKTIVIVDNLEPATIRGVESQGMLLAASCEGQVVLLTSDRSVPSGAVVR